MLKINNLDELESLKESYDIECKLALGKDGKGSLPKDIWESCSAFVNVLAYKPTYKWSTKEVADING